MMVTLLFIFFFFQAEDGIRDLTVTGVQTCALPILFGRPERVAERSKAGDIDKRQSRRVHVATICVGNSHLLRQVFAEKQWQSIHRVAEEPAMSVVEQAP